MKYLEKGGFQSQPLMRLTLTLTLGLLLAFWVTNFALYFSRMSLRPGSVVAYYCGSEEDFRPARSPESMLETTHMHLPVMALVLLLLTHLTIFASLPRRAKRVLIVGAFLSAVLEESGGWLVRFVSPALAPVKVVGFVGLQAAIVVLLASLARFLASAVRERNRGEGAEPEAFANGAAAPEAELTLERRGPGSQRGRSAP
ncbi:MAG TPA: hypothetical protein VMT70_00630 [Vicinamibacteria bacterium]|nr:hypothetical protein [Vicinamibacteria bacterium]